MQDRWMRALILLLSLSGLAHAEVIEPGAYEVGVEVRIPNVDVSNADFTKRICLRDQDDILETLGPMGPGPLRDCPGIVRMDGNSLIIDTTCGGPNAGWAVSTYVPTPLGFKGTVNLNMGGKNMTVQEVHRGTRVGLCD